MSVLRIREYVRSPGFRFVSDGPESGEWFRQTVLVPALQDAVGKGGKLTVELDGVAGYASSFLDEAFGGLVRKGLFARDVVESHLEIIARSPLFAPYRELSLRFIRSAIPERQAAVA